MEYLQLYSLMTGLLSGTQVLLMWPPGLNEFDTSALEYCHPVRVLDPPTSVTVTPLKRLFSFKNWNCRNDLFMSLPPAPPKGPLSPTLGTTAIRQQFSK